MGILSFPFYEKKLRLRDIQSLDQNHHASKWQGCDLIYLDPRRQVVMWLMHLGLGHALGKSHKSLGSVWLIYKRWNIFKLLKVSIWSTAMPP